MMPTTVRLPTMVRLTAGARTQTVRLDKVTIRVTSFHRKKFKASGTRWSLQSLLEKASVVPFSKTERLIVGGRMTLDNWVMERLSTPTKWQLR